ncbi:MAG: GH92 family glycosyl hydrolase [Prevotellaceae bacterium]|jgi:predicted alpha-1,2-mannosidase|nr:GH92 family glycosyl hydrolase [Prevotellaceae bacterium]
MTLKNTFYAALIGGGVTITAACGNHGGQEAAANPTQYVDPYIGTGGHGHVFLGANVPFGLVQLGPSNIPQTWDWCSGYHISDSTIIGFSHMHLSGTGIGDLGDVNLMPAVGEVTLSRGEAGDYSTGMYSLFDRATEKAKAGYYAVHLNRYNVDVELTATKRVGFHKYTFPASSESRVIIDLANGQAWDRPVEGYLVQESDTVVSGYRYSTGWARDQRIFFTATFSKPMKSFSVDLAEEQAGNALKGQRVYGQAFFDTKEKETLYVKVALSPVSIENAKLNMQAELPGWDFAQTVKEADKAWNEELEKIAISTKDKRQKRTFYTALYHTMIAPSEFCDVNGDYRGADGKMYANEGFKAYTTFSLWDTYRAAHPLMTIIHPEKVNDIVSSMLAIYRQQGKLPVWHLMGCETDCMVGNPAIPVVADAILKGYDGFDRELAYEAMKTSAMLNERGLKLLKQYGYIPYDCGESEGLSKCMEYAIADWSLAQVAQLLGKTDDYNYFLKRSKSYEYYFDKESGFMRGRSAKGAFRPSLNPFEAVHRDNDYTEGNAWQYTWLVPHDVEGLIGLFGGKERFLQKLDSLFIVEGALGEHASPDISGLIGQYAHGNEPSHHTIYLYPYAGQPQKTAYRVREALSTMYSDTPDGLSGNEDVGQMSAWYVLSSIGFYQVEPAGGKYVLGSPTVDKAVIKVKDGNTFTVIAVNNSPKNKYIQSVSLNGAPYDKYYIDFKDIEQGGVLEIVMGDAVK